MCVCVCVPEKLKPNLFQRLGKLVHKKTATAVVLTNVKRQGFLCSVYCVHFCSVCSEDRGSFNQLLEAVRTNFNERFDELRKRWGGGIMGSKALAARDKLERAKAKELASKMSA